MILYFSLGSCGPNNVQLSRIDLRLADSLYLVARNEWSDKLKDSCAVVKEQNFEMWVDSIKKERLTEINIMLDRNGKIK